MSADDGTDSEGGSSLSFEEQQWVDLLRELTPTDRNAIVTLIRSLAARKDGATLHDRQYAYRGE